MAEAEHRAVSLNRWAWAAAERVDRKSGPDPLEEVGGCEDVLVLAPAGPHRHVPHSTTGSPVPLALLAEVARLVDVVVVEVAELGVHAAAPGAWQDFVGLLQLLLLAGRLVIA